MFRQTSCLYLVLFRYFSPISAKSMPLRFNLDFELTITMADVRRDKRIRYTIKIPSVDIAGEIDPI